MLSASNSPYLDFYNGFTSYEKKSAPPELFWSGNFDLLTSGKRISVVGSRKVSTEGAERTASITQTLTDNGVIVVSGLAQGVDTIAHITALKSNGKTIAVLGTPLDKTTPVSNRNLQHEIMRNHLAISQFAKGESVFGSNFPKRNKTMALISDATIIIEASEKSGTRHQGWEAIRLGRALYIHESNWHEKKISWVKKMMEYGAQLVNEKSIGEIVNLTPSITSKLDFA